MIYVYARKATHAKQNYLAGLAKKTKNRKKNKNKNKNKNKKKNKTKQNKTKQKKNTHTHTQKPKQNKTKRRYSRPKSPPYMTARWRAVTTDFPFFNFNTPQFFMIFVEIH